MKKDQTNSKSRSKKNLGEIEATVTTDEKDVLDDNVQVLEETYVPEDAGHNSSSENSVDEEQESTHSQNDDEEQGPDHSQNTDEEPLSIPDELPILPLKDTVIYPFAVQPLGVGQERSIHLIDEVMRGNRLVVLVPVEIALSEIGPYIVLPGL